MTVQQLIDKLKTCNPSHQVYIFVGDGGEEEVEVVETRQYQCSGPNVVYLEQKPWVSPVKPGEVRSPDWSHVGPAHIPNT